MGPESSRSHLRRYMIGGGVLLLLVGAGFGGWWIWKNQQEKPTNNHPSVDQGVKPKPPDQNMWATKVDLAVFQANNRGVGKMDDYRYPAAAKAFEDVVRMAPDWLPGKINLGIALLNESKGTGPKAARARKLFGQVLQRDPDNPYAHFCMGILMSNAGRYQERKQTIAHFEAVLRQDPNDPAAWYWLGQNLYDDPDRAIQCFRRAIQLDPNMFGAYYALAGRLRGKDPKAAEAALKESRALKGRDETLPLGNVIGIVYSETGRYATVIGHQPLPSTHPAIGPLPLFKQNENLRVKLAEGTRWATREDLGKDPIGRLRARVRDRFGAVMVVLDYNKDGRPDLFLVGAVVRKGKVGDLLLRNDGDGRFTDVTVDAGLGDPRPSLGCSVADYNNDGFPDLLITGAGEQHLFRNTGKGRFEDVSAQAELNKLKTICLGAAFVDLDQDGDLDLVIAQYAGLDQAETALQGKGRVTGGGLALFLNVGEALPVSSPVVSPPLKTRFKRANLAALEGPAVPAVNLAVSDLDNDTDLDLFTLADHTPAALVVNDRLLHFHRLTLPEDLVAPGTWNGALVLDVNKDGRSDLLLVGPGRAPLLLVNQPGGTTKKAQNWFRQGVVDASPLLQAQVIDIDLDGWPDVVGLSDKHLPVLLHNKGGRLVQVKDGLGEDSSWPTDLVAVTVADFNGDGFPDFMVWSESKGLQLHESQGNGNHGLYLWPTGQHCLDKRTSRGMRCSADGFGVKVTAQSGAHWARAENATQSAGLGQSDQPMVLGLGKFREVEVVRLRWPDGVWQGELNLPTGRLVTLTETNHKPTSCPIVFTWDGERFVFVTDFLGAGSVGELEPDGTCRKPRPEESVKIEARQLKPLHGEYVLQLAEPMDEVTYLDRLQLVVLDHPADVVVYPDERFTDAGPPPTQKLLAFRKDRRVFPQKAVDHRGRDVTRILRKWDRDTVRGFARRSWIGLAEEHWVELDFGDALAKFGPKDRLFLCLAGWTDYPYPESYWAAKQAGVEVISPVLERLKEDGPSKKWEPVVTAAGKPVDLGFPAGLPKMMTFEITGLVGKESRTPLAGRRCVLRIRTNMEVYWDQAFIAPLETSEGPRAVFRPIPLEVHHAELSAHGIMQEFSPDGREPTLYDFDRLDRLPVSRLSGKMTRYGPVTELLRETDDCFVIFGPGDLLTVKFNARGLPALPDGWTRSFVLRTWGYCKDSSPFTATGETVEPLPFRAMSNYPYGPKEHYPRDEKHRAYLRKYNTREVGPGVAVRREP